MKSSHGAAFLSISKKKSRKWVRLAGGYKIGDNYARSDHKI